MCGSVDLKVSQHYPKLFGRTVAELAIRHLPESQEDCKARRPGLQNTRPSCPRPRAYLLDNAVPEMKARDLNPEFGTCGQDFGWAKMANLRPVIKALCT